MSALPEAAPRLLVLRALGLGDLLASVPALRGLRRLFPGHRLVLAAPGPLGAFAVRAGLADEALPAAPLAALDWPAVRRGHVAVNLHGSGPQSHHVLLATGPERLVAYANVDVPGVPGPVWRADEHEADRWCRLVEWAGGRADPEDLLLPAFPGVGERAGDVAVVHPGAASGSRRWPPERFSAVASALVRRGLRVVVTGGPGEVELAGSVADGAGLGPAGVLAGRTSLEDLVALLQRAALVVCGDTGVGHLAVACRTPSVHLFGPVSPRLWGPRRDRDLHRVLWRGDGTGDPHGEAVDPALGLITVDEVLATVDEVLTRSEGASAAAQAAS